MPDPARRRIRLAMAGGGEGSFIGAAHRVAARLDDQFEPVADVSSSEPARSLASGIAIGLPGDRCYSGFLQMVAREAQHQDGADVVAILTPNLLHALVATACLQHGLDVICEKPLAVALDEVAVMPATPSTRLLGELCSADLRCGRACHRGPESIRGRHRLQSAPCTRCAHQPEPQHLWRTA
ncbi:MAG: Gfo/Idh/MocA family oxidoreductase [Rhodoferax sp.]|nr:Gfo/Idh/MocA family oxidoreductase [Rhodoferax sp.]